MSKTTSSDIHLRSLPGDCIYNSYHSTDYTAVIRHAIASGHQIASHSWSHKDLTTCDNVTSKFLHIFGGPSDRYEVGQELDWMNSVFLFFLSFAETSKMHSGTQKGCGCGTCSHPAAYVSNFTNFRVTHQF